MTNLTTNPESVIDGESFTVRRTIRIAAPVDKVWTAITEPAHISKWFGHATFDGTGVGARGTLSWPDNTVPVVVEAVEEPRMVAYRWSDGDVVDPAHSTAFTFTLEETVGGTQLTVVETGFETTADPAGNLESHRGGWNSELDELVALLENHA